jgi:hypothetical protein
MMKASLREFNFMGLLLFLAIGCATASDQAIRSAILRQDDAYLDKVCNGEIEADFTPDRRLSCEERDRIRAWSKLGTARCDELVPLDEKSPRPTSSDARTLAKKLFECGQGAHVFERMLGERDADLLIQLEASGTDVEAYYVKYLESHQGAQYFPVDKAKVVTEEDLGKIAFAVSNVGKWLNTKDRTKLCGTIATATMGAHSLPRRKTLEYVENMQCKEIVPLAMEALQSDSARERWQACYVLGKVGDESVLEKLKIVADTDGYSGDWSNPQRWHTDPFPVRVVCRAAIGKIQLRK